MYDFPFEVHSYETDPEGFLRPASLCAFLQDAAWKNAERMGAGVPRLAAEGLTWVLQWLRLEIRSRARHGDALTVSTWARRFERVLALRDFAVRSEAGATVAVATSRWVVVNLVARRVVRLPAFIRSLPVPERPPALEVEPSAERPGSVPPTLERRFEVRQGDLDAARHVNNTRYLDWALETVPDALAARRHPASIEIVFRRESVRGDVVRSRSHPLDADGRIAHSLVRERDGEELTRATTTWVESGLAEPRDLP